MTSTLPRFSPARLLLAWLCTAVLGLISMAPAHAQDVIAYKVDGLHESATSPPDDMDLTNPRGLVRSFLQAGKAQRFADAGAALMIEDMPEQSREELADMLFEVIARQLWIDGGSLPDRPDAVVEAVGDNPRAGEARKSISLGTIDRGNFPVTVRVNRFVVEGEDPVWLFSPDTVDAIPDLYDIYGPGWLELRLPSWWRTDSLFGMQRWEIAALPALIGICTLIAWLIKTLIGWLAAHVGQGWVRRAVAASELPLALFGAAVFAQAIIGNALGFSGEITSILTPILIAAIVIALVIAILRIIDAGLDVITRRYVGEIDDGLSRDDRQFYTSIYALRRVITLIAFFVGSGLVLWELGVFRNVGISLLASAGVATVVLGIAAQTVLGNILASLQIAIAKPIRIGDSVNYEGDWAYVEAIFYTYIRLRTWDDRRLMVPVKYFISHPFENWSMTDAKLVKTFYLVVDHMADTEKLREKFLELAEQDDDAIKDEPLKMLVLDHDADGIHCRFYATAADPTTAWTMHARLREQMLIWIRDEHPDWWPCERVKSVGRNAGSVGDVDD